MSDVVARQTATRPSRLVFCFRPSRASPLLMTLVLSSLWLLAGEAIRAEPPRRIAANSGHRAIFDSERSRTLPLPPEQAAEQFELPAGFRVTLFAGEPDVRQPIAMATDPRGRLWVAENYTYAERAVGFHEALRDRILIFEDRDNDGRFDSRRVFWDDAQRLTSIEVGLGGVWALAPPHLLFLPDRDGDDRPDGAPEIVLDGFDHARARHNLANGLRWGPDGWLYGRHGILATSQVGVAGAPPGQRVAMNAGLWRFHPQRRAFEIVASGTTNPWGMDWDRHGELFFINTVIGQLWHAIPGAHFRRMFGPDPNPRTYELIDQHADHLHWASGEVWTEVRKGVSGATLAAGGGHAHVGLLIYQGGQWPGEWNGRVLTSNFHGRRFNIERLERHGSGYVGRHEADLFVARDPWFRALDLIAAPDGGVFVNDWSDTGECHDNDGVHRSSGRIFKFNHGSAPPPRPGDLTALSAGELVQLQHSENDWRARQARRVLADRAHARRGLDGAVAALDGIERNSGDTVHRLRALWTRHVIDASDTAQLVRLLQDRDEHIRAWSVRLLLELAATNEPQLATLAREHLAPLGRTEPSGLVRLHLASALQQLPVHARPAVASALLLHEEDATDHNLPLMLWYGIEPVANEPGGSFERLLIDARIPKVQRLGARRLAEEIDTAPHRFDGVLAAVASHPGHRESVRAVLEGVAAALSGRSRAPAPPSWREVREKLNATADDALRNRLRDLDALFGDGRALEQIRRVGLDPSADLGQRRAALQALIDLGAPGEWTSYEQLLRQRDFADLAAAALSRNGDPAVADALLAQWTELSAFARPLAMNALLSRPAWAAKVLDAVAAARIPRDDLTPAHEAQIRASGDTKLARRLRELTPERSGGSSGSQDEVIARWKQKLTPGVIAAADRARGRQWFQSICASCHKLHGEGGVIGPDLTGGNRDNLDYLLENILFPSAVVPESYQQVTLTMKDGRVLAGAIASRAGQTLQLQSPTGIQSIDIVGIAREERSSLSLMPPGLLEAVGEDAARDLIAYLMTREPSADGAAASARSR